MAAFGGLSGVRNAGVVCGTTGGAGSLPCGEARVDRWWKLLLCGLFVSLLIELMQLVSLRGMFDLDDLMNNTLGALLGWLCFARWRQCSR